MFPKIYYHFIEGQTFFKIPDVKLPEENSEAVVENAVKVSNRRLLVWVPSGCRPGLHPADASQEWALDPKLPGLSAAASLRYKETLCC